MKKNTQPLTRDELPAALKAIQIGVTEEDRLECCLHVGISYITLLRYMRGEVRKAHLGNAILNFLTERQNQPV